MRLFIFLVILIAFQLNAQTDLTPYQNIDVQHYKLELSLNNFNDQIEGTATVTIQFVNNTDKFVLDLVAKDGATTTKGMTVRSVETNGENLKFSHVGELLSIFDKVEKGTKKDYTIRYLGIPKDGLIISENKFGERTFFGDNWPTRAHNWFPCVDHPSDKATVEFLVTAPDEYQVVATGVLLEESKVDDGTFYHWKTDVILPTKVMVIGAAEFAVQHCGHVHNVPISSWVYPDNKEEGFHDYVQAKEVLAYYIEKMGGYPYEKLANVQSKTKFGGMENASNIFYFENSVTGDRKHEDLIAHEIVHQWFGNSASEKDWPHLWLSEGFATYLTDLYILDTHGNETFKKRMAAERNQVTKFALRSKNPVVDYKTTNLLHLLNPNSYQKGGWILHMIRDKVGNEAFWQAINDYYQAYEFSNANTADFKTILEKSTQMDFEAFFKQWLHTPGHPILNQNWEQKKEELSLVINQVQDGATFRFPLTIEIQFKDGTNQNERLEISEKQSSFTFKTDKKVTAIQLDPEVQLLFEEKE